MSEPIYKSFKARRAFRRNAGIVLLAVGLLMMVVCLRRPHPAALWIGLGGGLAVHVIGWILLANAYGPPVREVLVLARERRAALTPADLVAEMALDLADARAVLDRMTQEGLLRKADNAEAYLLAGDAPQPRVK
ncbi:MAG: hypothetical protein HYY16_14130 [Planctomycetes bacterium]|nr:hypothetical protein [Planctomycetota bacterium]